MAGMALALLALAVGVILGIIAQRLWDRRSLVRVRKPQCTCDDRTLILFNGHSSRCPRYEPPHTVVEEVFTLPAELNPENYQKEAQ